MGIHRTQPVDGWGPVQVSAYSPGWPWPWATQQVDTYDPAHYPQFAARTSVSEWQRKRYPGTHLRDPQGSNYVIPLRSSPAELPPPPNPYFERKMEARFARRDSTPEERYRLGQDIDWFTLGTRGA